MKYKLAPVLILLVCSVCCAQMQYMPASAKKDSVAPAKVRRMNHYLGFQSNQLLNQIFSFGNGAPAVANPYLIVYSMNSKQTGVGLNSGLGYTVNATTDKSDPNTTRTNTITDFSFRVGIEKKGYLSRKWLGSFGFDLLYGKQSDVAKTSSTFNFVTFTTETTQATRTLGGGPRLSLSYFISQRILVGTEATYYLKFLRIWDSTKNDDGQGNSSSNTTHQTTTELAPGLPVAIFLMVKL